MAHRSVCPPPSRFTLFGDTMNTASRMETTCRPGCVHVSETFAKLLPHEDWESTGGVQVRCCCAPKLDQPVLCGCCAVWQLPACLDMGLGHSVPAPLQPYS